MGGTYLLCPPVPTSMWSIENGIHSGFEPSYARYNHTSLLLHGWKLLMPTLLITLISLLRLFFNNALSNSSKVSYSKFAVPISPPPKASIILKAVPLNHLNVKIDSSVLEFKANFVGSHFNYLFHQQQSKSIMAALQRNERLARTRQTSHETAETH